MRRVHDVGEQYRGEHPIVGQLSLLAGKELGDLLERRAPRFDDVEKLRPGSSTYFAPGM